jgi:hypothetical protein
MAANRFITLGPEARMGASIPRRPEPGCQVLQLFFFVTFAEEKIS